MTDPVKSVTGVEGTTPKFLDKRTEEIYKDMQTKSLNLILIEGSLYLMKISRDGRRLRLDFKQINDQERYEFVKKQVAIYDNKWANVRGAIEVAAGVVGAAAVPGSFSLLSTNAYWIKPFEVGIGQGFQAFDKYADKRDQSELKRFGFLQETSNQVVNQHGEEMRQDDRIIEDMLRAMEKTSQQNFNLVQTLAR